MIFEITKSEGSTKEYCLHSSCKRIKKYTSPKGKIKKGSIIVKITIPFKSKVYPTRTVYYCRSCIDQILLDCRINLDAKLWVFK